MKSKKISWKKLVKEIEEAKKDPQFIEGIKEFIRFHSGKTLH